MKMHQAAYTTDFLSCASLGYCSENMIYGVVLMSHILSI